MGVLEAKKEGRRARRAGCTVLSFPKLRYINPCNISCILFEGVYWGRSIYSSGVAGFGYGGGQIRVEPKYQYRSRFCTLRWSVIATGGYGHIDIAEWGIA